MLTCHRVGNQASHQDRMPHLQKTQNQGQSVAFSFGHFCGVCRMKDEVWDSRDGFSFVYCKRIYLSLRLQRHMPRASDEKTAKGIKTRRHSSCYLPTSPLVLCHHNSALHYFAPHHPWCILSNKCIEFLHMLTPCSVRRSSSSLSQLPEVEA
jgi:hypothetical protein